MNKAEWIAAIDAAIEKYQSKRVGNDTPLTPLGEACKLGAAIHGGLDHCVAENKQVAPVSELKERIRTLESALLRLYLEQFEYVVINNLGDPDHNKSMQDARDALVRWVK